MMSKLSKKYGTEIFMAYEDCLLHVLEETRTTIVIYYPIFGITMWGLSKMSLHVLPSISPYFPQVWSAVCPLSCVWFLYVLKANFISNARMNQVALKIDQEWLSAFDKVSSLGLLALGLLGVVEASGVSLESLLTVSGAGGVATAFAARDVLGNMLSGLSLQLSRPFSVGEYIKAGPIEGTVLEIGLTSTSMINPEKLPFEVPNSLFSNQIILNRSRAKSRSSVMKIRIKVEDIEKVNALTHEIVAMLRFTPGVILETVAPYCYLSRLESSYGELIIGCDLKNMGKDQLLLIKQDILLEAARIIKSHGVDLGSSIPCTDIEAEIARILKSHGVELGSTTWCC